MTVYRIIISVGFENQTEAQTAWNWLKNNKTKFKNIASGEPWFIEIHKCSHDEVCRTPCEILERFEGT